MGSNPIGDASFLAVFPIIVSNPCKKQSSAENLFSGRGFFFLRLFFAAQKMGLLTLCGLPILQKISLRRRESRLAARAVPSAVKSIFRRPRSAAFRRHPPYSCLEYGSVDYIIFSPALRRASPSLSNPKWRVDRFNKFSAEDFSFCFLKAADWRI